jgi:MerR HTH family regulatory protein
MATAPTRRPASLRIVHRRSGEGRQPVEIEVIAYEAGLHPDLVRRLIRLGAAEPAGGTRARPLFPRSAAANLAKVMRLRRDLGLNYAGALLASQLLARIEELEERLREHESTIRRDRQR